MKKDLYAIIETGGKQYKVSPGDKLDVDFLNAGAGNEFDLDKVLLIADGEERIVGQPLIENAKVKAVCLNEKKGEKIIAFRYKNKARQRRKRGHRQLLSSIEIKHIVRPDGKILSKVSKEKPVSGGVV